MIHIIKTLVLSSIAINPSVDKELFKRDIINISQEIASAEYSKQVELLTQFKGIIVSETLNYNSNTYFELSWDYMNKYIINQAYSIDGSKVIISPANDKVISFHSFSVALAPKDKQLEELIRFHVENPGVPINNLVCRITEIILEKRLEPNIGYKNLISSLRTDAYFYSQIVEINDIEYLHITPSVPFLINFTPFRVPITAPNGINHTIRLP